MKSNQSPIDGKWYIHSIEEAKELMKKGITKEEMKISGSLYANAQATNDWKLHRKIAKLVAFGIYLPTPTAKFIGYNQP